GGPWGGGEYWLSTVFQPTSAASRPLVIQRALMLLLPAPRKGAAAVRCPPAAGAPPRRTRHGRSAPCYYPVQGGMLYSGRCRRSSGICGTSSGEIVRERAEPRRGRVVELLLAPEVRGT